MPRNLAIAAVLLVYLTDFTTAGNTTCAGNMTQWYTDAVGETACTTYQRLRQICNPTYQVPNFRPNTPGDQCDDQLQSCCCNSISWALSMLCMNCQWDVDGGSATGIDAGIGAYAMYRAPSGSFCSPGTNQSLPTDIQSAVCNKDIKLANFLYDLFWSDGPWFYVYTMSTGVKDEAATNNNMYTHCNSTTSTTSTAGTTSSSSGHSTSTSLAPSQTTTAILMASAQSSKVPTIVGAVVGSVAALVVAAAVARFLWRKRQRRIIPISLDIHGSYAPEGALISPYTVSDSTSGNQSSYRFEHTRKRGHPQMSSSFSAMSSSTTTVPAATVSETGQSLSNPLWNAGSPVSALRHEDAGAVPSVAAARLGSFRLGSWWVIDVSSLAELQQLATFES